MTKNTCHQEESASFWWQVVPVMMAGLVKYPVESKYTRKIEFQLSG